ncbi:VacJ family lipoprotein, partial [Roseomonas sp. DSM 102946]|nr:VacJ family lipoprotein [Roseomonas sp. DSM 102946]
MRSFRLLAITLVLGMSACATRPDPSDPEAVAEFQQTNDPIEPFNRAMFDVHQGIDKYALRPAALGYRAVLPQPVRDGVHNAIGNLKAPVIFINDVIQGEVGRARDTLTRFMLNSTVGLGGLFDVAASMGLPAHDADFGITAGKAG